MNWLSLIVKYLPLVLQCVMAVEAALQGTPGATKKQVVLGVIQAGTGAAEQIPQKDVQAIGGLIDTVVGTLNTTGVFTPATTP
jgi:hypothetical protein